MEFISDNAGPHVLFLKGNSAANITKFSGFAL